MPGLGPRIYGQGNVLHFPDDVLGVLVSEHPRQPGVGVQKTSVESGAKDADGGVVEDVPVFFLALGQGEFGVLLVGDVQDH